MIFPARNFHLLGLLGTFHGYVKSPDGICSKLAPNGVRLPPAYPRQANLSHLFDQIQLNRVRAGAVTSLRRDEGGLI